MFKKKKKSYNSVVLLSSKENQDSNSPLLFITIIYTHTHILPMQLQVIINLPYCNQKRL